MERIEWSTSTPLVKVIESWKKYPIKDFEFDFIITMRMREYAMSKDSIIKFPDGKQKVIPKKEMRIHIVFFNNKKVFQSA